MQIVYSDYDKGEEREDKKRRVDADRILLEQQTAQNKANPNGNHLKPLTEEHLRTLTDDLDEEVIIADEDLHHVLHQMSFSQSTKM